MLSTAYGGPVAYFLLVAGYDLIYLDPFEHYRKQTWRNRCTILGANGPLNLIIPVVHKPTINAPVRDIRIATYEPWQRIHWRTLFSAYGNSPFFRFYADDIEPFYTRHYSFLFDFNTGLFLKILELINLKKEILLTERCGGVPVSFTDYRMNLLHHKSADRESALRVQPYTQVFENKFPFIPNLSILDLLFNTGPGAASVLVSGAAGMFTREERVS